MTTNNASPTTTSDPISLHQIPQGPGSRLDSDTIDGLQTSPFHAPVPGTLVPLGPNGQLPSSSNFFAIAVGMLFGQ